MDDTMNNDVVMRPNQKSYEDNTNFQNEKQQMAEEFNLQRAKMKELFLQKEGEVKQLLNEKQSLECELDTVKEQLAQLQFFSCNQQREIESLQYLINETVENSTSDGARVDELQQRCLDLEQKLKMSKQTNTPEVSLAPSTLVQAVTKSIARKLKADGASSQNLEDSMQKAKEDVEMLKSLLQPLEEEIIALKDKLRETDAQLQTELQNKKIGRINESTGLCDMCANYEAQLVSQQRKCTEQEARATRAERALELAKEEYERCNSIHAESLSLWSATRDDLEQKLVTLTKRLEQGERFMKECEQRARRACQTALDRVTSLTVDRDQLQKTIDEVTEQNHRLIGRFLDNANSLQNDFINLPDTVEDLQENCLNLRESLIIACVGREEALQEQTVTKAKLTEVAQRLEASESMAKKAMKKIEMLQAEQGEMQAFANRLKEVECLLEQANEDKKKLSENVDELQGKVLSLQQELNTSETVQQDFVRLSQTLQVHLERIREGNSELRWQHDDDVPDCTECKKALLPHEKYHCRHCGGIFCKECLCKTVLSGPKKLPASVCSLCHTLLQPQSAPYFSDK